MDIYIYICRYIYYKPKVLELYTTFWTTQRGLHVAEGDPAGRNRAADAARAAGAAEPDGLQCFSQVSRVARHWEDMAQWKRGYLWILYHLSWWFMDIYGYLWIFMDIYGVYSNKHGDIMVIWFIMRIISLKTWWYMLYLQCNHNKKHWYHGDTMVMYNGDLVGGLEHFLFSIYWE